MNRRSNSVRQALAIVLVGAALPRAPKILGLAAPLDGGVELAAGESSWLAALRGKSMEIERFSASFSRALFDRDTVNRSREGTFVFVGMNVRAAAAASRFAH